MSNPLHYMSQLQCVGLVPIVGGVGEGVVTSGVAEMQYFILSVCLQYGFESVLMGVVESCLVVGYHLSLSHLIKWAEKTLDELVMEKNNMGKRRGGEEEGGRKVGIIFLRDYKIFGSFKFFEVGDLKFYSLQKNCTK